MSRIKVMSTLLSSRIAAGEVIERPASVVKELVENSIDAGASFIDVTIERAGSKLIRVADDGCGMDADDALLALEQHGTSKLFCEEDLDHIMTLGFRGEALPSIASVSRFTLMTRRSDAKEGTQVFTDAGAPPELSPCGGAVGTRIEVRDLFCNLPARKKFMKSAATEEHHIEEMVSLLAIGHPEIGFRLTLDNRVAFHSPGSGKIEYRLRELFGKSFVEKMLFFDHQEGNLHLSGCIGAPGFTRPSRRDQRVFINSRAVEAQAVYRGIREGYSTLAEPGRYNPVILFLEMPPEELDVNVHPAKREVRFKSEYAVSRAVASAVSAALRRMRSPEEIPQQEGAKALPLSGKLPLSMVLDASEVRYPLPEKVQPELSITPAPEPQPQKIPAAPAAPFVPDEDAAAASRLPERSVLLTDRNAASAAVPPEKTEAPEDPSLPPPMLEKPLPAGNTAAFTGDWPTRIIGVLDNTYIIGEAPSGLVLIDQHAAHERVMFETILAEARKGSAVQQRLLLPETLELPRSTVALLLKNKKIFEQLGFDVESAGGCTVMVNSLPLTLGGKDVERLFTDMLHELLENQDNRLPVELEYVARAACRAAVKAHEALSQEELEALVAKLRNCRQGTLCPHGRPTLLAITLKELEKRFGRR